MNDHDRIENLSDTLRQLEDEMDTRRDAVARASRSPWPTLVFVLVASLALVNIYFVNQLMTQFQGMITGMTEMYTHFGHVASRMSDMRRYVTNMESNVTMMPPINDEMGAMSANITDITGNVSSMDRNIGIMDQRVAVMGATVTDMSQRFRHLNHNVGIMRYDVNQMSQPVP